jgi:hypothetical protein
VCSSGASSPSESAASHCHFWTVSRQTQPATALPPPSHLPSFLRSLNAHVSALPFKYALRSLQMVDYIMMVVYYCLGWSLHPTTTESIIGCLACSLCHCYSTYATAIPCTPSRIASTPATLSALVPAESAAHQLAPDMKASSLHFDLNYLICHQRSFIDFTVLKGATRVVVFHLRSYGGWLANRNPTQHHY